MRTVSGDLIQLAKEGRFDVIVHGCNCWHTMGAGLAAQVRRHFPQAEAADRATPRGGRAKLGTCSVAEVQTGGGRLHVVNAYTQFDYAGDDVLVDYDAVRKCMRWIKSEFSGRRIGLPQIGAGLAGGDWARIEAIIGEELAGEDVTIVQFKGGA